MYQRLLLSLSIVFITFIAQSQDFISDSTSAEEDLELLQSLSDSNNTLAYQLAIGLLDNPKSNYDSLEYSSLMNLAGNFAYKLSNYDDAFQLYENAIRIKERNSGTPSSIAAGYLNMSNVLMQTNSYDKSLKYLRESISYLSKDESAPLKKIAYRHNAIGLIYYHLGNYDSSKYYYQLTIDELKADSTADEVDLTYTFDNLALMLVELNQIDEAIEYFKKSIEITQKNNLHYDIAFTADHLAYHYVKKGSEEKAKEYLRIAKEALKKSPSLEQKKNLAYTEMEFYSTFFNVDSLSHYVGLYQDYSEELLEEKGRRSIQEMETKYDVEKKESQLAFSKERAGRLDAENRNQKIYLVSIFALLIILFVLFVIANRSYKRKKEMTQLELEVKESRLDELMSEQESNVYAAMLEGQDNERERVARDLHDRLGGTLAALRLSLTKKGSEVGKDELEILDHAVQEVRSISHNLSIGLIHKYGLNQAIAQLSKTIEKSGGIKFNLYLHRGIAEIGQKKSIELYRIVQELVSNTLKHAEATEVSLQTNIANERLNFIYEDNGKGFDSSKMKGGIGIENIKARVESLNGSLHIDTAIGRGTIVIIEMQKG